jgi:predicted RNA-binding protein with PUA-like domain
MAKKYWLMKSEPDVYGIDHLRKEGTTHWDGIRNYQARNIMRDDMKVGDDVLFYHSNAKPPGVAGIAKVSSTPYPDHTAWDKKSKYYDPKSNEDEPRWFMVDVDFVEKFGGVISLAELKEIPGLEEIMVTRKGMRLSIQPVTADEFKVIRKIGRGRGRDSDSDSDS